MVFGYGYVKSGRAYPPWMVVYFLGCKVFRSIRFSGSHTLKPFQLSGRLGQDEKL